MQFFTISRVFLHFLTFFTLFLQKYQHFLLQKTLSYNPSNPRRHLCRGSETLYFAFNTCCTQQLVLLMLINNSESRGNPLFFYFYFLNPGIVRILRLLILTMRCLNQLYIKTSLTVAISYLRLLLCRGKTMANSSRFGQAEWSPIGLRQ